jgi:hypothetical protein
MASVIVSSAIGRRFELQPGFVGYIVAKTRHVAQIGLVFLLNVASLAEKQQIPIS